MQNILQLLKRVKWAWQRIWRGWDDTAVWGIDSWLIDILPAMLEELRKHKGYPSMMVTEDIASLPQDRLDKICIKKWNDILDKIIKGFEAADQIIDGGGPTWDSYFLEYEKIHGGALDWTSVECNDTRDTLWKDLNMNERLKKEQEEHYAVFNEGMNLFKEYFFNLWW